MDNKPIVHNGTYIIKYGLLQHCYQAMHKHCCAFAFSRTYSNTSIYPEHGHYPNTTVINLQKMQRFSLLSHPLKFMPGKFIKQIIQVKVNTDINNRDIANMTMPLTTIASRTRETANTFEW